jgi:hypothetical protein
MTHAYRRTFFGGAIGKGATDIGRAQAFTIASMPGWVDLASVYDGYYIRKVTLHFNLSTDLGAQTATAAQLPIMAYLPDYDDDTPPTTYNAVLQGSLHKIWFPSPLNNHLAVSVTPRTASVVAQSGTGTLGVAWNPGNMVCDVAFPDLKHYGFKYFLLNYNTTTYPNTTIFVHYEVEFTMVSSRSG